MRHYTHENLLRLAATKDAGFTTATFLNALNAIKRLTDADWAEDGIDADSVPSLREVFAKWHTSLAAYT